MNQLIYPRLWYNSVMPIFTREPEEIALHSLDDVLAEVRRLVSVHGTQAAAAKALGITPAYLSDVLKGKRQVSEQFAARVGYIPEVWFRKAEGLQ
jgi:hypothetical protein